MFSRATALLALLTTLAASSKLASAGFVSTNGTSFQLDGKPFYFLGTNAYWAPETIWSDEELTTIFTEMANNNLTVCRTWGFNEVTSVPSEGAYYQLWNNGTATINTGERGLEYFDKVVAAAKAAGVKLVVALVNNWEDYGGMDEYVRQLGGQYHDDFYTSEVIKDTFKTYIKAFVTRYKDEDAIMAWQLSNESRCGGYGGPPRSDKCTPQTIAAWMSEISAYIKSLDSNHLVAPGDEGWLTTNPDMYSYSGYDGVDFDININIETLDYGTYHAYPDGWAVPTNASKEWGLQWIEDHVASANKANKPVVLEEYGVVGQDPEIYKAWSDAILAKKSNLQFWQLGIRSLQNFTDPYTIHTTDAIFASTIVPAAAQFKALE